jgi:3-dehydroquinate synthase
MSPRTRRAVRLTARAGGVRTSLHFESGGLDRLGALLRGVGIAPGPCALVTDRRVGALYGARARAALRRAGLAPACVVTVPAGERSKSLAQAGRLFDAFARAGLERGRPVVALGGGVVGDLAGFAAATWLRGVPLVLVPTTVLAQLDASIGGKVAVDLPCGKNLVGAFHQPVLVVADPDVLATLPRRQVRAGLAEAAKVGFTLEPRLVAHLERHAEALRQGGPGAMPALREAIVRAARAKVRVVEADERDQGPRQLLNYGHTVGHALETLGGYRRWLHGEAVALGMVVAARAAVRRGLLGAAVERRQADLLRRLGLPVRLPGPTDGRRGAAGSGPVSARKLLSIMQLDKKRQGGGLRFVLTRGVGVASFGQPLGRAEVLAALQDMGAAP